MTYFEFQTIGEIRTALTKKNDATIKRRIKILTQYGATEQHVAGFASISGLRNAVGVPTGANAELLKHGVSRMFDALTQVRRCAPEENWELRKYDFIDADQSRDAIYDLPAYKRLIEPSLKIAFSSYFGKFSVVAAPMGPSISCHVVGVGHSKTANSGGGQRSGRRRATPGALSASEVMHLDGSMVHWAAASARFWQLASSKFIQHNDEETQSKEMLRKIEMECFVLETLIRPDRAMFGKLLMKRTQRSLSRQLLVHAESFDLAGFSPLQSEAVIPFLARLPTEVQGAKTALPVVKLL